MKSNSGNDDIVCGNDSLFKAIDVMSFKSDSNSMIQKILPSALWVLAFVCSLFLVNDWQLELFGACVVLTFVWAVTQMIRKIEWHIPYSYVLGIMAAFWLVAFLSVIGSDILFVSVMAFCLFSVMPLSFFIHGMFTFEREIIFTAKALSFIYAALSVWAVLQFTVFAEYSGGRAHHPLANPNSLAALFSLGYFCAVGWMISAATQRQRIVGLVMALLLFAGILAAGSRGALFALIPTLIMFLFFTRGQIKGVGKNIFILLGVSILLFLLTDYGLNENQNIFDRVIDSKTDSINSLSNNRVSLWMATWGIIKSYGLWGTGIGTYYLYFPEFRLSDDLFGTYYAHNDPLQYWAELGLAGIVLFYSFVIAVIIRTVKAVKIATTTEQKMLILAPFFALTACVIHTHITFNFYNLSILMAAGFLLAVWFYATNQVLQTHAKIISFPVTYKSYVRGCYIALPFVILGFIFSCYIVSEHYTNKARDYLLRGDLEPFAQNVVTAQKISFDGNYRPYLLAVNVPLGILQEASDKVTPEQKKSMTQTALYYMQHVRGINPRSSSALYYLGLLKEIGDADVMKNVPETADYFFEQAVKIDPLHVGARVELSKIYVEQGDRTGAIELLERGYLYKYGSTNAMNLYTALLSLYLQNGDIDKREGVLKKMRDFQQSYENKANQQKKPLIRQIWGDR